MTNLDSVLKKQRHHFANKGLYSQCYSFSNSHVQMWEWTIKKGEHQRIDAFALWCWRILLRVPWTAQRSNKSILKGNQLSIFFRRTATVAETPILWPPDAMSRSLEKTLMLARIEGKRRRGRQRMRWVDSITKLNGHEFEQTVRWWRTVKPGMLQSMGSQRVRHEWATKQQNIIIPIQRMI